MNETTFRIAMAGIATTFTVVFCVVVVPPLIDDPDIVAAILAGFVNPYASGYSTDVIFCWVALAVWVAYDSRAFSIKYGWICLVLGVVPGVAVGFPLYLVLRQMQISRASESS